MTDFEKTLILGCGCLHPMCGKIQFALEEIAGEKILDIGLIPYRCKKVKGGMVIRGKDFEKLISFLNPNNNSLTEKELDKTLEVAIEELKLLNHYQ